MKTYQLRKMKTHAISAFAFAILAGCAPEVTNWTPAENPKENKVDRSVFTYTVCYPAHAEGMAPLERKKLYQFLKNNIASPFAVKVTIVEYGGYSEKRIKDIERELLKYGIPYDLITVDYDHAEEFCELQYNPNLHSQYKMSQKGSASRVKIIVERFIVIPPSCANFSQQIGNAQQSQASSNFGCSTLTNLGMMVANPRDLLRGREGTSYDGTVIAAGIQRYRSDKIKAIAEVSTTASTQTPQGAPSSPTAGAGAAGGY